MPIKVLVIEDHPIVRDGCQKIFARRPDIEMADASTGQDGLARNRAFQPDVIILDVGLPDGSGLDIMAALRADNPAARLIVFSMYEAARFVTSALERGAMGYISKNDDPNTILAAIDKVLTGSVYLGQSVAQNLALVNFEATRDPLQELSERERQVVGLLGDGKSLSEISAALGIGYKSAANLVSAIKQKLQIATSAALVKFAVERTKA